MNIDESDLQVMQDYMDDLCDRCAVQRQLIWSHPKSTAQSLLEDAMRQAIDANPERNPASDK